MHRYAQLVLCVVLPVVIGASSDQPKVASNHVVPFSGSGSTTTKGAVDIIRKNGYPVEIHQTTTEDGYIITLHRIPANRTVENKGGQPVLLHHGFLSCSGGWVVLGAGHALGFELADKGFDVWMTNARGTTYSKDHKFLSHKGRAYWDFSWHEVGKYDIPAEIDYVLETTGYPSLTYIGHSMGTTAFWVMGSTRPEYMSKVNKMVALAPVAYFEYARGPLLRKLASLATKLRWVLTTLGTGEFLPSNDFMTWAIKAFCTDSAPVKDRRMCRNIMFLLFGYDSPKVNATLIDAVSEFDPAGGSVKEMLHYAQLVMQAPTFRMYDYGIVRNIIKYGQSRPPNYQLNRVSCPVYVFMSSNDWFAGEKDVWRLVSHMPNIKSVKLVERPNFNHLDFLIASDARNLVYDHVVRILETEE